MLTQTTIGRRVQTTGIGLHSGQRVEMAFLPAPPDAGVVFRRVDLSPVVELSADPRLVRDTRLSTCLVGDDGTRVGTIEHLMSALAGLGVDNIVVELSASETPILDGSAAGFILLLRGAGIVLQPAPKRFFRILEPIEVVENEKFARVVPHDGFAVAFEIDFKHPMFSKANQTYTFDAARHAYAREISRARTFGFVADVETLYGLGLAQGGNLDNAIVLDDNTVLNPDGLRYDDEFVRHKILDAIGDLYLIGCPLIGKVEAFKSSHALNNRLAREILLRPDAVEVIDPTRFDGLPEPATNWMPMVAS